MRSQYRKRKVCSLTDRHTDKIFILDAHSSDKSSQKYQDSIVISTRKNDVSFCKTFIE